MNNKRRVFRCSYQKRAGGGMTEARRLYLLYPVNEKGVKQDWNLIELFDQKHFLLPSLQNKNGVGEACLKYLKRQKFWKQLIKNVEKRNERAG